MRSFIASLALLFTLSGVSTALAQFPTATEEHQILKQEDGKWDAEITMFQGPAGPYSPPQKSKASESNKMIGDFWLISDFKGSFEGMEFTGRGQFGFDPQKKKYVGSWIDSFSPNATKMVGSYDKAKKTMTYETTGIGMDGNPVKGKNVVVYGKDSRVMTMWSAAPDTGEMIKVMEITYKRAK